jgi:DNA-binding NarL/FixJ family response regulator
MKKMIEPFITDIVKDFNFPMESVKGFKWSKKAVIERLREKGYIKRGRRSMYSSRSNKNGVLSPIDSKHSAIIDLLMEGHSQRFISEELSVSRNMVRNVADHMNGKRRIVYVVFKTDKN